MIQLRPRQIKLKKDIRIACANKFKKILIQAPPGFGKTPTMASIIFDAVANNKKILFLVHRKELINQCSKTLDKLGVIHSVLVNKHPKLNLSLPVQLSSWQTMKGLVKNGKIEIFIPDIIIYDEAHRSVAEQARRILDCYPCAYLFGFTGTPYRPDEKGLKELYETLITTCSTNDLINEGLIIKPIYHRCADLGKVTTYLKQVDGEEILDPDLADKIIKADFVRNYKKICPNEQGVVFCSNTEQARIVAENFNNAGISANMIECKTKNREQLLNDFASKKFQVITNASLLSEGWDYPPLGSVVFLRNINSRVFYRQAANRCMRIHPGKTKAYILDFFNCWEKYEGLPWDDEDNLYELENDKDKKTRKKEIKPDLMNIRSCNNCNIIIDCKDTHCPECGAPVNIKMEKIIAEAVNDLEVLGEEEVAKVKATKDEKQKEFDKLCSICLNKKYKPGWVSQQYKKKFG